MAKIEDAYTNLVEAVRNYGITNAMRIANAISGGHALLTLKAEAQHGDFMAMVDRAGLNKRTAQVWMQLARSGMKPATVAYFGGMNASIREHRAVSLEMQATRAALERDGQGDDDLVGMDAEDVTRLVGDAMNAFTAQDASRDRIAS